ncbi:hypothetical protein NCCP691_35150 [Noviherbaspirillum aridicola]|uniref:diguanylate cyclase n=2 Tax=Noviherbaspirillum aridicola TaxID=2849687 RepID=A0ABQ4Q8X9_9BURK|nr:hypothetical protein NCCP691_35150 [Noviherbaspirillum aridicola]
MNRRNRSLCSLLLLATIGAHLFDKGAGPVVWALASVQYLIYPQLLYLVARGSTRPREAEIRNLLLDGFCGGLWAAGLGFPVWITFILLVTVTINVTVFRGRRGFWQAAAAMSAGAVPAWLAFGARFSPETGWPATLLAILTVGVYVMIVAENAYARALGLQEARAQLRERELALKRQLEEISGLQAQLREQANRDPLTGLYNRRYFDASFERELARCQREGLPLSLVMIDVDHFKQINDRHGHPVGDEVLKALSELLQQQVRASDIACRYGGEEFLVLLPSAPPEVASARVDEWRRAFAACSVAAGDGKVHATLSAGVAGFPAHALTSNELLRRADAALYRAKTAGRNRVTVAADTTDEAVCFA